MPHLLLFTPTTAPSCRCHCDSFNGSTPHSEDTVQGFMIEISTGEVGGGYSIKKPITNGQALSVHQHCSTQDI